MRLITILLFGLLWQGTSLVLYAQIPESVVLAKLVEPGGKQKRLIPNRALKETGIRLDYEALQADSLLLEFDNITQLGLIFKKGRQGLALSHYNPANPEMTTRVVRIKKKEVLAQVRPQWLVAKGINDQAEASRKSWSAFKKKFKGKKRFSRLMKKATWQVYLGRASALLPQLPEQSWRLEFLRGKRWYGLLYADTVQTMSIYQMPNFTLADCVPCSRYELLFNMVNRDLQALEFSPFVPRGELRRTRTFSMRFAKNEVNYDPEDVAGIITFLQDSNFVVHKAQIKGFASVEGDSLNNSRLMAARADVLMQALDAVNDGDSITLELETTENWELFEKQLRQKGYDTTITREEWRALFYNDSIGEAMEPLLAKQRKAELKLFVSIRLQPQQKISLALSLYRRYVLRYELSKNNLNRYQTISRIMAIRNWLISEVVAGRLDEETLCALDPIPDNMWSIFLLYEMSKSLQRGEAIYCGGFKALIVDAHHASLYLSRQYPGNPTYMNHLRDIQVIAFRLIKSGKLEPDVLCELNLPDEPAYYEFTISQLYFVSYQVPHLYAANPCERLSSLAPANPWQLYASAKVASPAPQDTARVNKRGPFYYLIKKRVLDGEDLFARYTNRPEGQLLSFDIYNFLEFNINGWDVELDSLYDPEVSADVMDQQLRRLLRNPGPICPPNLDALALSFHRKVLLNAVYRQSPHALLPNSVKSIGVYYARHAAKLDDTQAARITGLLLAANSYCYQQEGALQAYSILDGFLARNPGTETLRKQYYRLALMLTPHAGRTLITSLIETHDPITGMGSGPDNLPLELLPPQTKATLSATQAELLPVE